MGGCWHYGLCLIISPISESGPSPRRVCVFSFAGTRGLTFTCAQEADLMHSLSISSPGISMPPSLTRGQKWNYINFAFFSFPFVFLSDFNLSGPADRQPPLSPRVTVVEISPRGSMQISADGGLGVEKGGKKRRDEIYFFSDMCLWDAQTHKRYLCL